MGITKRELSGYDYDNDIIILSNMMEIYACAGNDYRTDVTESDLIHIEEQIEAVGL